MATERQVAANRCNATKSTGPKTIEGKHRSRMNAYRHGLTAETVVSRFEEAADYEILEASLIGDFRPRTTLEHQLVVRLASLIWRLRRASKIETGLFKMQTKALQQALERERSNMFPPSRAMQMLHTLVRDPAPPISDQPDPSLAPEPSAAPPAKPGPASVYLRLYQAAPDVIHHLERYETAIWRQLSQTVVLLNIVRR